MTKRGASLPMPKYPGPLRPRGKLPLRLLHEGQEFRTLLTGRLGYIYWKDRWQVNVIIEPHDREVILSPGVVVLAL